MFKILGQSNVTWLINSLSVQRSELIKFFHGMSTNLVKVTSLVVPNCCWQKFNRNNNSTIHIVFLFCHLTSVLWFCSLIIVCLVLITEIATWWYDHRTEQKNNTLPSHGIEPCTSCFPGRRINHCTRKECWSFVSFRLMFEGEHFEHNTVP